MIDSASSPSLFSARTLTMNTSFGPVMSDVNCVLPPVSHFFSVTNSLGNSTRTCSMVRTFHAGGVSPPSTANNTETSS